MTTIEEIRIQKKIYLIITNINIFIQTIIFYNVYTQFPDNDYYYLLKIMIYLLYVFNFIIICSMNKIIIQNYINLCTIFNIYYIILSFVFKTYFASIIYILLYNFWNSLYLYRNRILEFESNQNIVNIVPRQNIVSRQNNRTEPISEIEIDVEDEAEDEVEENTSSESSKSSDEDIYYSDDFNHIVNSKNNIKNECVICFIKYKNNNMITTRCNHLFHEKCLRKWLKIDNICPICRTRDPLS